MKDTLEIYLNPTFFIDSDHEDVIQYTKSIVKEESDPIEQAKALYLAVRDGIFYSPYDLKLNHQSLKASNLLNRTPKVGYCIEKACLLAACGRVLGIPTRLGFGNVRNHIGTEKLIEELKTDLMVFHGYTEFYLNGKWVKATPAFNIELCHKLNVTPLEFDGQNDSVLQQFDASGNDYMEFEHDYGQFHDVPHDLFIRELIKHYPHMMNKERFIAFGLHHHTKYFEFLALEKHDKLFETEKQSNELELKWKLLSRTALPLWATGGQIRFVSEDWREIHVSLSLSPLTKNIVGTIFGGSLYSSVDPIYMLMWMKILGESYVIWDKAATIQFVRPGTGKLRARFLIEDEEVDQVLELFQTHDHFDRNYEVIYLNERNKVVAKIGKTVYFAKKEFYDNIKRKK